jgi:LytS/YehU family sensor histidine kinase
MVWLARRYRIDRGNWRRFVPLHALFALGFHVADAVVMRVLPSLLGGVGRGVPIDVALVQQLFINLTCYAVVVALTYAVDYAGLYRERELAAAQLAAQLNAARLHALQSQLRPHFLFNTLNTIAEQVHSDADGADRMITRLATLLRASFVDGQEVSLRDELDVLRSYVDIMAVRFRGRLAVDFDVDPDALEAAVPRFLLQPLVENALRHGIEPLERGGVVDVVARRRVDILEIEVRDSGRGLPAEAPAHEGVGLRNTRDRLRQLYGPAHHFALRPRVGGGAIAAVAIPFRPAAGRLA